MAKKRRGGGRWLKLEGSGGSGRLFDEGDFYYFYVFHVEDVCYFVGFGVPPGEERVLGIPRKRLEFRFGSSDHVLANEEEFFSVWYY